MAVIRLKGNLVRKRDCGAALLVRLLRNKDIQRIGAEKLLSVVVIYVFPEIWTVAPADNDDILRKTFLHVPPNVIKHAANLGFYERKPTFLLFLPFNIKVFAAGEIGNSCIRIARISAETLQCTWREIREMAVAELPIMETGEMHTNNPFRKTETFQFSHKVGDVLFRQIPPLDRRI